MKQLLLPLFLLATTYCQAAPIIPEEAKNYVGEDVHVRSETKQVSFSKKGHAFLNFGGRYPNQVFTGFIQARRMLPPWEAKSSSNPWLAIQLP